MDCLVVPTVRFRLLYAWFVIGHGRREIIRFGVTEHQPTPEARVVGLPRVGGLHHGYQWQESA